VVGIIIGIFVIVSWIFFLTVRDGITGNYIF
jgi:hypothetical protein